MSTATQTPALGSTAVVIAAPGYPTEATVIVSTVAGHAVTASMVTASGLHAMETYTLRRNGKYALKGGGQWANYLRFAA